MGTRRYEPPIEGLVGVLGARLARVLSHWRIFAGGVGHPQEVLLHARASARDCCKQVRCHSISIGHLTCEMSDTSCPGENTFLLFPTFWGLNSDPSGERLLKKSWMK